MIKTCLNNVDFLETIISFARICVFFYPQKPSESLLDVCSLHEAIIKDNNVHVKKNMMGFSYRCDTEGLGVARVISCEGSGQQVEDGPYRAEYKFLKARMYIRKCTTTLSIDSEYREVNFGRGRVQQV